MKAHSQKEGMLYLVSYVLGSEIANKAV